MRLTSAGSVVVCPGTKLISRYLITPAELRFVGSARITSCLDVTFSR